MLTPLRRALGEWSPRSGPRSESRDQALGAIVALWTEIVGEDVARHAIPLERTGSALLVLVSSSAWSNQLSLLAGHVIGALREAGVSGIESLRFRVGKSRQRTRTSRADGETSGNGIGGVVEQGMGEGPAVRSAPETAEEALARLRERITLARDAKRARGWNQCEECGALSNPDPDRNRCAPCASRRAALRSAHVQRLMFDAPWLGFAGTAELVAELTRREYEANRGVLLGRWWETLQRAATAGKLGSDGYERQIASSYLLLRTGWEPERITPAIARNELGDKLYELIYGHHNDSARI
ncbi:MAG: DUF721 domain-containing protein [Candidatus Eremiobacteraeota bacterium]|nr:DUF721 domain-containing protein [Candidatus Eremiobacteraeota bacterium]